MIRCRSVDSMACIHGTFLAGILFAKRGLSAPAICPRCTLLLRRIFSEGTSNNNNTNVKEKVSQDKEIYFPYTNYKDLSNAIVEVVDKGVNIINLSLGLSNSSLTLYKELQEDL